MRLPVLILLAATLLFWGFYTRYEPVGPPLLELLSLDDATTLRGDCTESNGTFLLRVEPGGTAASINFRIPEATSYDRIRVRGRIRIENVVTGRYPWSCARLLLIQYDNDGKWISGHHGVIAEEGTLDWTYCMDVFELDERAAHADLVIQQLGKSGSAAFTDLIADPVQLRASYTFWKTAFSVLWIAMGVGYYRRCRMHVRRLRILILLNALAIICGVLMPETWIVGTAEYAREEATRVMAAREKAAPPVSAAPRVSGSAVRADPGASAPPAPAPAVDTDPSAAINTFNRMVGGLHGAGHFALFSSLCFLLYLSAGLEGKPRSYFFKVAADLLLFAAITESLQHLTLDRRPGFSDWLMDVYGMLAALALFLPVGAWFLLRSATPEKRLKA